jgi:hypothetical protein
MRHWQWSVSGSARWFAALPLVAVFRVFRTEKTLRAVWWLVVGGYALAAVAPFNFSALVMAIASRNGNRRLRAIVAALRTALTDVSLRRPPSSRTFGQRPLHRIAQRIVDSCLVVPTTRAEVCQHISIDADSGGDLGGRALCAAALLPHRRSEHFL